MFCREIYCWYFLLAALLLSYSCVKEQEDEMITSSSGIDKKGGEYFPYPAFFPDSLLMVVDGRTLYQSYNGVITSSLSRPFFMPSEWYAESSHFEEGGKTVNKYYYTLSNTDYE